MAQIQFNVHSMDVINLSKVHLLNLKLETMSTDVSRISCSMKKTFKMWLMKTTLSMQRHRTMAINALSAKIGSRLSCINRTLDFSNSTIVETRAVLRQMQLNWHWQI